MKNPKKKQKQARNNFIITAFSAGIGAICGFLIAQFMETFWVETTSAGQKLLYTSLLFVGLYAAFLLQVILHEAGHLVFGLMTGYKFCSFRIFSFMWVKESGAIKLRRFSLVGTSGQCLMSPPELVDGRMPVFLYNLGGVFANLLASAIALGLYSIVSENTIFSELLKMFIVIGVGFALMNGIPMRMGTVYNDGCNAFSLRRSKEAQRAFWIQMKTSEQTARGVRIKDMPEEWFEVPSDSAMKNSLIADLGVFACNRLVDAHRFAEADRLMEHLLAIDSRIDGIHRNLLICDRIYIALIQGRRKDSLDGFLTEQQKKFMKSMKNFPSVIRTEYAYALLGQQDLAKAEKFKALFEKRAKSYPYPSDVQSERELMEIAEKVPAQMG